MTEFKSGLNAGFDIPAKAVEGKKKDRNPQGRDEITLAYPSPRTLHIRQAGSCSRPGNDSL